MEGDEVCNQLSGGLNTKKNIFTESHHMMPGYFDPFIEILLLIMS